MRNENQRYVFGTYLLASALVFITLDMAVAGGLHLLGWSNILSYGLPEFLKISRVAAFTLTLAGLVALMMNARANGFMLEVFSELRKVAWPLPFKTNTWLPTVVVVIFVIICALILGVFDWVWGSLVRVIFSS